MEVTSVLDEPTAANNVLQIQNGAVVDIGGGTTGTSVIQDGIVIHSDDDATGGMHCTYVIAGNFRIPFEEAELIKMDKSRELEVLTIVTPVIQKMAVIVEKHIQSYSVDSIVLCGGTACLKGIDTTMEKTINIKTYKPHNPFLVTPMGIAMGCPPYTV
jgi:ethanolamine utilization protein EutJ